MVGVMAVTEVTDVNLAGNDHLCAEHVEIVYPGSRRDATTTLAVDGVSLTVRRGEFVVIVGPSGCGKTTLLNAVAGFIGINGGSLTLDGSPITAPSPERAMVFQQPSLLPWRSVLGNIAYGLDLARREPAAGRRARATELLHLVGLGEFGSRYPGQLSGGQQQRVNLARALAVRPSLLLLDEPFASIDAQTREQMQAELLRICAEEAVTALFVTHDITEAAFLADRVIVFGPRPGRIVREVAVPFPRPREGALRRDARFAEVVEEIATALYAAEAPR
jgi:NitT/TauT family transport system ATP-binding protein